MGNNVEIREVNQFANHVRRLAVAAPDPQARAELHRTVRHLQIRYEMTPEEKAQRIVSTIRNGAVLFSEIRDESGLGKNAVVRILKDLVNRKILKVDRRTSTLSDKGGRPTNHYSVVEV